MIKNRGNTTHNKLLKVSSSAFKNNMQMPGKYSRGGKNINPPFAIKSIPVTAKTLVIIMVNTNAPYGRRLHWMVWNLPVTHKIKAGEVPGKFGLNDFGSRQYCGPFIKSHANYTFKIYALDCVLKKIDKNITKYKLERAMAGHITAYGEITGSFGGEIPVTII
ncbi:MAG: YbhB/YbcL family Raf kinase inhibitor-like protein [Panacibacter sp.]